MQETAVLGIGIPFAAIVRDIFDFTEAYQKVVLKK